VAVRHCQMCYGEYRISRRILHWCIWG